MARNVLITGANRGIGLEFVRQLLARGDRVVATCRHPGKATALNSLAGEHPGRLRVLPLDVAEPKSRAELLRELPLVLGDEDDRLDLLVNNAGVLHSGERFGQAGQDGVRISDGCLPHQHGSTLRHCRHVGQATDPRGFDECLEYETASA